MNNIPTPFIIDYVCKANYTGVYIYFKFYIDDNSQFDLIYGCVKFICRNKKLINFECIISCKKIFIRNEIVKIIINLSYLMFKGDI